MDVCKGYCLYGSALFQYGNNLIDAKNIVLDKIMK